MTFLLKTGHCEDHAVDHDVLSVLHLDLEQVTINHKYRSQKILSRRQSKSLFFHS